MRSRRWQLCAALGCAGWLSLALLALLPAGPDARAPRQPQPPADAEPAAGSTSPLAPAADPRVLASSPAARSATKSLAEVAAMPPSAHVLLFNRVPKAGGEMLVLLLQWLQGRNGFRHVRLGPGPRRMTRSQQESLVETIMKTIRDEAVPVAFDRHVYFINFTLFDKQSPTYINLVRDPVDKAASRFYYARVTPDPRNPDLHYAPPRLNKNFISSNFDECVALQDPECTFETGQPYDLTIPYFCGHEEWCMQLNNRMALEKAKENVEHFFPVVGVLEELNATLASLESNLPYFFKGVQKMYFEELLQPHKNRNRKKPPEVAHKTRKWLHSQLELEYEFYYWLRARLLTQIQ
ncbi:uronyl 2-sulfotransferase-like [Schistocerca gregaria]|uniref:uronyl 2-sulfotransferase-like n=2 Tax=Schistocerca TaxID=7008 RepID=UPI00211DF446|nr:uronyl 2-sulfotransferase-like [Schistocerca gregaria]